MSKSDWNCQVKNCLDIKQKPFSEQSKGFFVDGRKNFARINGERSSHENLLADKRFCRRKKIYA